MINLHDLKKYVAGIRASMPPEAKDGIITSSFLDDNGQQYRVVIDGLPPVDAVSITCNEELIFQVSNWGAQVIEDEVMDILSHTDSPALTEQRRQALIDSTKNKKSN